MGEHLQVRRRQEEVQRLSLVDPLLATGGGVDEPLIFNREGRQVLVLDDLRNLRDVLQLAVEVLNLLHHLLTPQTQLLQIAHEVAIEFGELAGEVALHEEILVRRFDARRATHDIGNRGGRSDREDVRIAHTALGDFGADRRPVHEAATFDLDRFAALLLEQVDGVLRQQAAIPFRSLVGAVGAAFSGQIGGGVVRVVGDGFHDLVVKLDRGVGGEGDISAIETVLEAHHAHADGAVAEIGNLGGLGRVEVDIDDVVEGTHRDRDGLAEHRMVDTAIGLEMGVEDDGSEVADRGFLSARVERDLGAKVGGVDNADVVLRGTDIARVLEGDPRMARFKNHPEHLLPKLEGGHLLTENLTLLGEGFVGDVAFLEVGAEGLVQIRDFVGKEERPVLAILEALHEQVGNPVRRVHVMRATAVVAGVLAELEEVLDIIVPSLEVGAAGAAALPALIDGDELVVVQLKERNDALRFAVGALDVGARSADRSPRSTEAAGPLGEEGVFRDTTDHDGLDRVVDLVEVAGGELAVERAGIEERRGRAAEAAGLIERMEADDPFLAVLRLLEEETHRDAHPEELGCLEAAGGLHRLVDNEVAIIHRLDAE